MGEFGEKLRKQREQRGITLEAVSNTTKIGTRMLKALEDERFDQLPGGVFNKGFVRAYARQIGLDAEEAVNDYLAALRESQAQAQAIMPDFRAAHLEPAEQFEAATAPGNEISGTHPHIEVQTKEVQKKEVRKEVRQDDAPPPDAYRDAARQKEEPPPAASEVQKQKAAERVEERPRRKVIGERPAQPKFQPAVRIPWGIVSAGLLVVALLLAFLSYHPRPERRAEQKAEQKADRQEERNEDRKEDRQEDRKDVQKDDRNATSQPANSAGESPIASSSIPPATTSPATTAPLARPNSAPPASSGTSAPSSGASAASSTPAPAPVTAKPAATDTSSATAHPAMPSVSSPTARAKAPREFTLRIRAEETSWVSITADGKPVAQETLIAPAGTSVRATQEIVVRTRNAGGLLFVLNGKTLPRQGQPGETQTFLFDANGMHVIVPPSTTAP